MNSRSMSFAGGRDRGLSTTGRPTFPDTGPQSVLGKTFGYEPKNPYLQEIKTYGATRRSLNLKSTLNLESTFKSNYSVNNKVSPVTIARKPSVVPRRMSETRGKYNVNGTRNAKKSFGYSFRLDEFEPQTGRSNEENELEASLNVSAYDVEVQVQPRVREKATQSENKPSLNESAKLQPENDEVLEENFRMRRLVDDLRFRLAETANEKESLQEEITKIHSTRLHIEPMIQKEAFDQECQTDVSAPEEIPPRLSSTSNVSELFDDDRVSPLPPKAKQPKPVVNRQTTRTISYLNLRDIPDNEDPSNIQEGADERQKETTRRVNKNMPVEAGNFLRDTMRGHLARVQLLDNLEEERTRRSQALVQNVFRSHLRRLSFLKLEK